MVKEAKESTLSPPFYTFNSVKPFPIKITSNQWLFQSLLRATLLSHLAMRVLTQLISLVSVCSCGLRVFGDDNVLDLNIKFHDFGKIISRCLTSKNLYTTRRVKITFFIWLFNSSWLHLDDGFTNSLKCWSLHALPGKSLINSMIYFLVWFSIIF